jgi:hypothetical protein
MPRLTPQSSSLRKQLEDPTALGTILLIILVDQWGTEFFDWEPETLQRQAMDDFGANIPTHNRDKIWALVTYLTQSRFFSDLDLFIHICNALSGSGADFQSYDPAMVQEIAWCLAETQLLEPPDTNEVLSPEIQFYIDAQLKEEGFTQPPRLLRAYASDPEPESTVDETLAIDEIDTKSFWDSQAMKREAVDLYVRNQLYRLFQELSALPLVHADREAINQLLTRAGKALELQSKEIEQVQEAVPARPSL